MIINAKYRYLAIDASGANETAHPPAEPTAAVEE
jgi:hypothetical protein